MTVKSATTKGVTFTQKTFDQDGMINSGYDKDRISGILLGPHENQNIKTSQNSILKSGLDKIREDNKFKKDHI